MIKELLSTYKRLNKKKISWLIIYVNGHVLNQVVYSFTIGLLVYTHLVVL